MVYVIGRTEYLLAVLVPYALEGAVVLYTRRRNEASLPPGSVVAEPTSPEVEASAPGTPFSMYGGLVGHFISDLSIWTLIAVYLLSYAVPSVDLMGYMSPLILDFPASVNWAGIAGLWFLDALNASILAYNVNFTPCTRPMASRYVLATGGPYRYVRHPTYLSESLGTIFVLFATGFWINFLGVVSWFALLGQAKAEEAMLQRRFGKIYADYAAKTGMFIPKIRQ